MNYKTVIPHNARNIITNDYHFMAQTNTGQWAEKHGPGGNSEIHPLGMTPDTIPWTLGGVPFYDDGPIYYAIGSK